MSDLTKLRGKARYRKIMGAATRCAAELWLLEKSAWLRTEKRQQAARSRLYKRQAVRITKLAMRLGGLIIKAGQYASTRVDMLPAEYTSTFSKLQDSIPPADLGEVKALLEAELGRPIEEVFPTFEDEPVAAASIGQVHRAWLPDGTKVAVKVQRPGIDDLVTTDLEALHDILKMADRWTSISQMLDIEAVYEVFESTFTAELDYIKEGRNADTFRKNLAGFNVEIPQIYWQLTSRKVLVMEYMEGIKVNDLAALDAAGMDRAQVAKTLLELYLQMVLRDGFYHADPHPGNILVGPGSVVQLLDFGMVAYVTEEDRLKYIEFAVAVVRKDSRKAISVLVELGFLQPDADTQTLIRLFSPILETALNGTWNDVPRLPQEAIEDLRGLMFNQPFYFPGSVTFLGKGLITVLGVCLNLDTQLDLFSEVTTLARKYVGTAAFSQMVGESFEQGKSLLRNLLPTAANVMEVSKKANTGDLTVRVSRTQEGKLLRLQYRLAVRLGKLMLASLVVLAGLVVALVSPLWWLGWVVFAFGGIGAVVQTRGLIRLDPDRKLKSIDEVMSG
ncbi:MAG: AarF/ABC1/UbiB kinase family protein [Propionibacteriaceae bacterium]|nr:AarF/ABC1/UbiB kinase family protein [Propionibacteriaceae bacterium]